ncbi:MAG: hypothetical protein EOM24_15640, partial [Chloroflexia bacterium]|nr:hypothetical protein [Chloroflexia bacterium]
MLGSAFFSISNQFSEKRTCVSVHVRVISSIWRVHSTEVAGIPGMVGMPGMVGIPGMIGMFGMPGMFGMLTEEAATLSAHNLVSSSCCSRAYFTVPRQVSTVFCQASGLWGVAIICIEETQLSQTFCCVVVKVLSISFACFVQSMPTLLVY